MFCNVYKDKKNPINTVDGHTHTVYYGGVIFEENKLDTYRGPNCFRTPIPEFHFLVLLLNLAQGLIKF